MWREFWARIHIWEASAFRWCLKPEDWVRYPDVCVCMCTQRRKFKDQALGDSKVNITIMGFQID